MKKILLNGVDGNFGGKSAGILLEKYPHEDLIFTAPREKALKKYKEMGIDGKVYSFGQEIADKVRLLYGGSVKPNNVAGFMACSDIDGALVGGASLKADSFAQIVRY